MSVGVALRSVQISRVEALRTRFAGRFETKFFRPDECAYCNQRRRSAQHWAARLAAKFAVRRLLGSAKGVRLRDVEIVRDSAGAPGIRLHGATAGAAAGLEWLVSLSHDGDTAVALVLAQMQQP